VSGVEDLADGKDPLKSLFPTGNPLMSTVPGLLGLRLWVSFVVMVTAFEARSGANNVPPRRQRDWPSPWLKAGPLSGSHVSQAGAGLEGNLRISPGIQCNEVDRQ